MYWANKSTRRSTVEEETEYDNYAVTERKTVSEEEVVPKTGRLLPDFKDNF